MLLITGEVRKVLDDEYKNKSGNLVKQAVVIIEPVIGRHNFEIYLSRSQVDSGVADTWTKLIGKQASISVTLFVNYEYKFQKFNALGNGQPLRKHLQGDLWILRICTHGCKKMHCLT